MALNQNQISHRAHQMMNVIYTLADDDKRAILEHVASQYGYVLVSTEDAPEDDDEITSVMPIFKRAMKAGLERGDARWAHPAMEYEEKQRGKDYLSELTVEITPYRVKDDSLAKIVLEAGDDIVNQIEEALKKRRVKQ